MDRSNGGFGRGYVQGNNTRAQQKAPTDRPQPTRQEDEWSLPTNVERRDNTERHQTSHPPSTEERRLSKRKGKTTNAICKKC